MRFYFGGPRVAGLRTGVSFGPEDFRKTARRSTSDGKIDGGFIYVVRGTHGLVKVGISTNPNARLAQLQTASPFAVSFAYLGAMRGFGQNVEAAAHAILARYRMEGEWFDCPPEMAVAAISAAAHSLGEPLASVDPLIVDKVVQIASSAAPHDHRRGGVRKYLAIFAITFLAAVFVFTIIAISFATSKTP